MQFSSEERAYIWLDSFPLDEGEKRKLLSKAGSAVGLVKNLEKFKDLAVGFGKESVYNTMQKSLLDGGKYFESVLSKLSEAGIFPIPYPAKDYPAPWRTFSDAPLVLYAKGDSSLLQKKLFGIVGSRRTSAQALKIGEKIAEAVSLHFPILTGTADGGDSSAIEGAIKGSGEVVCLLAGGFGSIPSGNLPLLQRASKKGLFLSPHAYDVPVRNFSYEYRNKLLAALSCGVLVLGAGEKSGALITAKHAKLLEKPIFALPYPPLNSAGVGCNGLIKQGAYLTETEEDVLGFYGLEAKKKEMIALTEQEQKIYEFLKEKGEGHLSEISSAVSLPTFRATAVLSALEMKGLVVKLGGNRFSSI